MSSRVVIACGGTGGHLFPGIAVAEALVARGHESLLLISEKQIDSVAAKDHPELRFESVPAIALPRLVSPRMIPFAIKFWRTLRRTRRILRSFKADAVLGMGGFTSLPPVLTGRCLGARTFIHESNAIPGKANRLTARFCDAVLLGMAACARHFPPGKTKVVGTPLRAALRRTVDKHEAYAFFGLDPKKTTVLVMGGSQGARAINQALMRELPRLDAGRVQLIHLTGADAEAEVREALQGAGIQAFVAPFSHRLDLAYAITDVCLARCGGSSLAELAYFGVPAILIPYPFAAEDHQSRNAQVFAEAGAALRLPQPELETTRFDGLIANLLADGERRARMRQAMLALAFPNAAEAAADVVLGPG